MADPFTPLNAPVASGADPYRPTTRTDTAAAAMPNRVQPESVGGFGAGMLVVAVFVVVAILAAMVYSNRDYFFSPAADDAVPASGGSNITIENNAAPAADAPATAPGVAPSTPPAPAADPVVPAPEATAPAPAPQPAAPANP